MKSLLPKTTPASFRTHTSRRSLRKKSFGIAGFLSLMLCLGVSSCNLGVKDPSYSALFGKAETSISRDAIVGMWHRHHNVPGGMRFRMSMLIRPDGNGLVDSVANDPLLGHKGIGDEIGPFTWNYQGKGVWTLTNNSGRTDICRMSGGRLLREYHSQAWHAKASGPGYYVYERVDP